MSKKNLIIIAGVAVLVLGVIAGGFFMLWTKLSSLDKPQEAGAVQPETQAQKPSIGPVFPLDSFIVNLSDQGGKRYLRVTMTLELSDPKIAEQLTPRLPQVRDAILMILPNKKVEELQTTEGKHALRTELMAKLNEMAGNGSVKNIFFTEFVIQ